MTKVAPADRQGFGFDVTPPEHGGPAQPTPMWVSLNVLTTTEWEAAGSALKAGFDDWEAYIAELNARVRDKGGGGSVQASLTHTRTHTLHTLLLADANVLQQQLSFLQVLDAHGRRAGVCSWHHVGHHPLSRLSLYRVCHIHTKVRHSSSLQAVRHQALICVLCFAFHFVCPWRCTPHSIRMSCFAALTIAGILTCVVALLVLTGRSLGAIEAVTLVRFLGVRC